MYVARRVLLFAFIIAPHGSLFCAAQTPSKTVTRSAKVTTSVTMTHSPSRTWTSSSTESVTVGAVPSLTATPSQAPFAPNQYPMNGANEQRATVSAYFGPASPPSREGVFETGKDSIGSIAVDAAGRAFLRCVDGTLLAVSFNSSLAPNQLWAISTSSSSSTPIALDTSGSSVFAVCTASGTNAGTFLCAYSTSTGVLMWSFATLGGEAIRFAPVVAPSINAVFINTLRFMHAIDASSGIALWSYALTPFTSVSFTTSCAVSLSGDTVCSGTSTGEVVCLETVSGTPIWRVKTSTTAGGINNPPMIFDGVLYSQSNKNVTALDLQTGSYRWVFPVATGTTYAQTPGAVLRSFTAAAGGSPIDAVVFAATEDDGAAIYIINAATGASVRTIAISCGVGCAPLLSAVTVDAASALYVTLLSQNTYFTELMRYNASTGTQTYAYSLSYPVNSIPALSYFAVVVGNPITYYSDASGVLYAFPVAQPVTTLSPTASWSPSIPATPSITASPAS